MHISSSYAKILGEKLFRTWEIPQSGSKAEDGGKKRKKEREKEERKLVITMAKLRMAHASTHGARKPPGPKFKNSYRDEGIAPFEGCSLVCGCHKLTEV